MANPRSTNRRQRLTHKPKIDPGLLALLTDEPQPDGVDALEWLLLDDPDALRGHWKQHRDAILQEWVRTKPGTRPSHWWLFEAPRAADVGEHEGWFYEADLIEPRLLLEGEGRPAWSRLAIVPAWHLGIPTTWVDGDPETLVFESQFDYLNRHGLLQEDEGRSREPDDIIPYLYEF